MRFLKSVDAFVHLQRTCTSIVIYNYVGEIGRILNLMGPNLQIMKNRQSCKSQLPQGNIEKSRP